MKTMIMLYADEGKILTNGKTYGTTISLAENVSAEGYYEITVEEYEKIMEEQAKEEELELI